MSYRKALELSGAKIFEFEEFGTYSGDWYALIEYNGVIGIVRGNYGSCSGCDSFLAEFGYDEPTDSALVAFSLSYLDNIISVEEAIVLARPSSEWDMEANDVLNWLEGLKKVEHHELFNKKFHKEILE